MKKITLVLFVLGLVFHVQAEQRNLQALFSYKTFYSPDKGPYIETYLSVNAQSVQYKKNANNKFQGSIQIELTFSNETGIKYADKYNLLSPEVDDTSNIEFNFLDQQRIQLKNGTYNIGLSITDKNANQQPYSVTQGFTMEYYDNIASISDIQFVESYSKSETPSIITKSGFDLVPYVDNYFPSSAKSIKFYAEIYSTDKVLGEAPYLATFFVESADSKQVIENLKGFTKQNPGKVNVLLREIPISELPSGNYNLVIEIRNQQNELLASETSFFQHTNKLMPVATDDDFSKTEINNTFASYITDKDTLSDFINSLHPISNTLDRTFLTNQMKLADVKMMQQFFYDFWVKRNPENPEKAWLEYHQEVLKVDESYGTRIQPGYATDRGRVYLQYGPPNTMNQHYAEPSAYPYEIWHYYKLGMQTNRKFIFYNPDLVTNDFELLHSDAQGEVNNARWQMVVFKRDTQSNDLDVEKKSGDYFGNKVEENFQNPK